MPGPGVVEIGFVARAHGVRGEIRIVTHEPSSTTLGEVDVVLVNGQPRTVEGARKVAGAYLVKLAGIDDRDAAAALRGAVIAVDRDDIAVAEGQVLLADLVGCQAVLSDGQIFGEVVAVEAGLQDRLVIRLGDILRELPFVPELVTAIDLAAGVITVDPPEELPEIPVT
ncbi:MAG TPA: ribosome maturation factor RimM [Kofleriaceae bacterium]|nr:ribosome maturation factor RimM [Kofleriaceae bacterium]